MAAASRSKTRPGPRMKRRRISRDKFVAALKAAGLSLQQVREELLLRGLSGRMEHFLKGAGNPRTDVFLALADILRCSLEDLVEEVPS